MKWPARAHSPVDVEWATKSPILYLLGRAWEFAGGFTFFWLIASVAIPGWSTGMTQGQLLVVATFAGLLTSLFQLMVIRSSSRPAEPTGTRRS